MPRHCILWRRLLFYKREGLASSFPLLKVYYERENQVILLKYIISKEVEASFHVYYEQGMLVLPHRDLTTQRRFPRPSQRGVSTLICQANDFRCKGGKFDLTINLPQNYPFKPPTVVFTTKIYHPNISNDSPPNTGAMCLGMLKDSEWKPSTKMSAVLEFARQLLKGTLSPVQTGDSLAVVGRACSWAFAKASSLT